MYKKIRNNDLFIEYLKRNNSDKKIIELLKEQGFYTVLNEYFPNVSLMHERINKRVNIFIRKFVLDIINHFDREKIDYICFKGLPLSKLLYEDELCRIAGDVDIYVSPDDFDKAYTVIKKIGYYLCDENDKLNPHHLVVSNGKIVVELHHRILAPKLDIDEKYLLSHTAYQMINGYPIRTFDITATFLHLLYHLYMDSYVVFENLHRLYSTLQIPVAK